MFTGIITEIGILYDIVNISSIREICIEITNKEFIKSKEIGGSIAINGVCLTIVKIEYNKLWFQVMKKTLERTNLHLLKKKHYVNIEGAMKKDSYIDGHIVSGHIDGTVIVTKINKNLDNSMFIYMKIKDVDSFDFNWIVERGSITLNGVSLTVAELYEDEFMVSLIPYTIENTLFKDIKINNILNVEFDQNLKISNISRNIVTQELIGRRIISHSHAMKLAIEIGELGKIGAPPNPWVGCIIVKHEKIIGVGYHKRCGEAHAEVNAIKNVKENAIKDNNENELYGSTMYVTLEPCNHFGRTPPCCNMIIDNKISEVYIAVKDPDPQVSGSGIKCLLDNNINVITGIETELASKSLEPYIYNRITKKPYIILKMAISLDGKMAANNGTSKWISCDKSREDVHRLRSDAQGILVGVNTCLNDNPRLNVRLENYKGNQPIRIVLDSYGKLIDKTLNILDQKISKTIIFTSRQCNMETIKLWEKLNIQYYIIKKDQNNKLDIDSVHNKLGELGIMQVIVEGGSEIFTNYIEENKYNKIVLYQGATIIGSNGLSLFNKILGDDIENKLILKLESTEKIGKCNKIIYYK